MRSGRLLTEDDKASSTEEQQLKPEIIQNNLPTTTEILPSEDTIATFNIPFFGEMLSPEVIASSVIAAGTASVVSVAGGIAMQSVLVFYQEKLPENIY